MDKPASAENEDLMETPKQAVAAKPGRSQAATKTLEMAASPVKANVAGAFYPGDPVVLRGMVEGFMKAAENKHLSNIWALIAPHAGYRFSGPIAASAFKQVAGRPIKRVVVIAFAHNPFTGSGGLKHDGIATVPAPSFETPLGGVKVDVKELKELMSRYPFIRSARSLAEGEHSLEVELPFIQVALPDAKLVPLFFGNQRNPDLAKALGTVLAERYALRGDTLVVVSSDMSHYFPYDEANKIDGRGLKFLRTLDAEGLMRAASGRKAEFCGLLPVISLIYAQKIISGQAPTVLDYRNSGDTYGDKSRVVGYAAVAFQRSFGASKHVLKSITKGRKMDYSLSEEQKSFLLGIARKTVVSYVKDRSKPGFDVKDPLLLEKGAAFVTLKIDDNLRGCIGHTEAHIPLWECVRDMAVAACSQDPRFPPVTKEDLAVLSYEITVLTPMQKVESIDDILVGRDGLMMEKGFNRGLLLPQVPVEWGWNRDEFLSHTAQKAGMPMDAWKDGSVTIYSFQGLVFSDGD